MSNVLVRFVHCYLESISTSFPPYVVSVNSFSLFNIVYRPSIIFERQSRTMPFKLPMVPGFQTYSKVNNIIKIKKEKKSFSERHCEGFRNKLIIYIFALETRITP